MKNTDMLILGAGASRAESTAMPLLSDFFQTAINDPSFVEHAIWCTFATLDYYRILPSPCRKSENLAAQLLGSIEWNIENAIKMKSNKDFIGRIEKYGEIWKKRADQENFNFEDVFDSAFIWSKEHHHRYIPGSPTEPNALNSGTRDQDAYFLPQWQLLRLVDHTIRICNLKTLLSGEGKVYEKMAKLISNKTLPQNIVSFNYDTLLEEQLKRINKFDYSTGYGHNFSRVFKKGSVHSCVPREIRDSPVICKPHGSLNWYLQFFGKLPKPEFAAVLGDHKLECPASLYRYDQHGNKFIPLFLPPTISKSGRIPILYNQWRQMSEWLVEADRITIVGWSVPRTDSAINSVLKHAFPPNRKQLSELTYVTVEPVIEETLETILQIMRPRRFNLKPKGLKNYLDDM